MLNWLGLRTKMIPKNIVVKPALEKIDTGCKIVMSGAAIKALADCINSYLDISMKHSAWPAAAFAISGFIDAWVNAIGDQIMIRQINAVPESYWQTAKNISGGLFMLAGTALFGYGTNQMDAGIRGRTDDYKADAEWYDAYAFVLGPVLTLIGRELRKDYLQSLVDQKNPVNSNGEEVDQIAILGVGGQAGTRLLARAMGPTATQQRSGIGNYQTIDVADDAFPALPAAGGRGRGGRR